MDFPTKHATLPDFLTEAQIQRCVSIFQDGPTRRAPAGSVAKAICENVIKPNLAEINAKLGNENNPMYLAYAVEYVLTQAASMS